MKKLLIILLALAMILSIVACGDKKSTSSDDKDDKKEKKTEEVTDTEAKEEATTEEPANAEFEFTFKSLKLKVSSIEDYEYDPENDRFGAPEGKYVKVNCNILEGKEATSELSGIYNALKLAGAEPVNVGTSGIMDMEGGKMFVATETIITFTFDVPADFDAARPDFTAE